MIVNQKERLYSVSEVAEVLGISSERVIQLVASPYVDKVTYGNRLMIPRNTFRDLIQRKDV